MGFKWASLGKLIKIRRSGRGRRSESRIDMKLITCALPPAANGSGLVNFTAPTRALVKECEGKQPERFAYCAGFAAAPGLVEFAK
jgi:hypothetical protein